MINCLESIMKKLMLACAVSLFCIESQAVPDYLEYYNISCPSLSEIAGKTMRDWQNNATFKDMLENSTVYGKTLYKNSNISLNDAEMHTFAMINKARKETIRDTLFYKEYAAVRFASDYDMVCQLKALSLGKDLVSKHNNCRDEDIFASGLMDSRQAGVPIDDLLRANQDEYDKKILTHGYENIRSRNLYESINRTLLDAYSRPFENSALMKEKSSTDFGQEYYVQCMSK